MHISATPISHPPFLFSSVFLLFDFLALPGNAARPCVLEADVLVTCLEGNTAGCAGAAFPSTPRSCCRRPKASAAAALQASCCFWLSPAPRAFRKYASSAPCARIGSHSHALIMSWPEHPTHVASSISACKLGFFACSCQSLSKWPLCVITDYM